MITLWIACKNCKRPLAKAEPLNGVEILCFAAECPDCKSRCGLQNTKFRLVKQKQQPVYEGDCIDERVIVQQNEA